MYSTYAKNTILTSLVGASTLQELIEDVKAPFVRTLPIRARLFEQVALDVRAADEAREIEVDPNELAEPRGVVILHRLRIAKRLENRIRLQQLLLKLALQNRKNARASNVQYVVAQRTRTVLVRTVHKSPTLTISDRNA